MLPENPESVAVASPPPVPARPRVWTALLALPLGVGAMVAGSFLGTLLIAVAGVARAVLAEGSQALQRAPQIVAEAGIGTTLPTLMLATAVGIGALGGMALLCATVSPEPLRARLRLEPSGASAGVFALAVLATLAIGQSAQSALALGGWRSETMQRLEGLFARASFPEILLALVVVGLLAGTVEELFFRGYVQRRLAERWGPRAGLVVTSAAFGLYHLELAHALMAFCIGAFFGWLAERTGSIRPSVVAHVGNNALATLLAWQFASDSARADVLLAGSLAVAVGSVFALHHLLPGRTSPAAVPTA